MSEENKNDYRKARGILVQLESTDEELYAYDERMQHEKAQYQKLYTDYIALQQRIEELKEVNEILEIAVLLSSACISHHLGETHIGDYPDVDLACAAIEATDGIRTIKYLDAKVMGQRLLDEKIAGL